MYHYLRAEIIAPPIQVFPPLFIMWLLLILLGLIIQLFIRDWQWTAILLFIFSLTFYSDQTLFWTLGISSLVLVAGLVSFRWFRRHSKTGAGQINLYLSIFFLVVAVVALAAVVFSLQSVPENLRQVMNANEHLNLSQELSIPRERPDIYYIVLDAYARSDVLRNQYSFDNSVFINRLRERGFIVPSDVLSNYSYTTLSLTSTLNMEYISSLVPGLQFSQFQWLMTPLIQRSRVRILLESLGYQMVSISDEYALTNNPSADKFIKTGLTPISDYAYFLLETTPIGLFRPVLAKLGFVASQDSHREMIRSQFAAAARTVELPSPKFVFVHIMAPHPPFVFDANGNPVTPKYPFMLLDNSTLQGTREEYINGYVGQVQFINDATIKLLDSILSKSNRPPIIIIQADHGAKLESLEGGNPRTCMDGYFSPLAAYYLPGTRKDTVPDDITPVNLFRIIFNDYFGGDLPLLNNQQFFAPNMEYIYQTKDVSGEFSQKCSISP